MEMIVTDVQKYSIHDGTGIRTTVFFKGCPLRCRWCHNPETQRRERELYVYAKRCQGCGACRTECRQEAVQLIRNGEGAVAHTDRTRCTACGSCIDICVCNAREICGKEYTVSEIVKEVLKDRSFYETSGGGVTLSGGEVLSQDTGELTELVRRLSNLGIRVNIDTCGAVPYAKIEAVVPYTDTFLYDVKCMDEEMHRRYTGSTNEQILENLVRLSREKTKIWIRVPVVGGVNDTKENMIQMMNFLLENKISPEHIHLLPYHAMGQEKCSRLGLDPGELFPVPSENRMRELQMTLEQAGAAEVYIGG